MSRKQITGLEEERIPALNSQAGWPSTSDAPTGPPLSLPSGATPLLPLSLYSIPSIQEESFSIDFICIKASRTHGPLDPPSLAQQIRHHGRMEGSPSPEEPSTLHSARVFLGVLPLSRVCLCFIGSGAPGVGCYRLLIVHGDAWETDPGQRCCSRWSVCTAL